MSDAGIAKRGKRERRSLEAVLYDWLGQDWCGSTGPPANYLTLYAKDKRYEKLEYVFSTLGDGFELGIGYPHEWLAIIPKSVALRGAWFIIWRWWIRGTWCGLRQVIWYWLLNRRCASYRKGTPQP